MKQIKLKSIKLDADISTWKNGENDTLDYVKVLNQRIKELESLASQLNGPARETDTNGDYSYYASDPKKYKVKHDTYFKNAKQFVTIIDKIDKQLKRIKEAQDYLYGSHTYRAIRY